MSRAGNILTASVSRAVDILFVQNPRGSSLGALGGVVVHGVLKIFAPAPGQAKALFDASGLNIFYFVAAGVFSFNIPLLFLRRRLPTEIEDGFEAIRRLRSNGVPDVQIRFQLLALCNIVISRASLRPKTAGEERSEIPQVPKQ